MTHPEFNLARGQAVSDVQTHRFSGYSLDTICNADMPMGEMRQFCKVQEKDQRLMQTTMSHMKYRGKRIIVF